MVTALWEHLQRPNFIVVICKAVAVVLQAHITVEQLVHAPAAGQVERPTVHIMFRNYQLLINPLAVPEEEEQVDIHVQVVIYTVQLEDMAVQIEAIIHVLVEFMCIKAVMLLIILLEH
jgi:hypothetical protein